MEMVWGKYWSSRKVSQNIHNFVKMTEAKLDAPFLERWQIGGCKKFSIV